TLILKSMLFRLDHDCFRFRLKDELVFFFFQAEDGIRDGHVTGVQTCALPICSRVAPRSRFTIAAGARVVRTCCGRSTAPRATSRSEERRVGKECRSRWSP